MIDATEQEVMALWPKDTKPLVSCCCVTYNHSRYIAGCLDSILSQITTFPFELIIRDDCSTDNTALIIRDYARRFPKIIKPIFEKENQYSLGQRPLPVVLALAEGKYIATIDGDDRWSDVHKLQLQTDFLEKNDGFSISYHNASEVDEDERLITENKYVNLRDFDSVTMICKAPPVLTSTAMFRNIGPSLYPERFKNIPNGDTSLWHILGFHGMGRYQNEISNTIYHVHYKGMASGRDESERLERSLTTMKLLRSNISSDEMLRREINITIIRFYEKLLIEVFRKQRYGKLFYHCRKVISDKDISLLKLILNKIYRKISSS